MTVTLPVAVAYRPPPRAGAAVAAVAARACPRAMPLAPPPPPPPPVAKLDSRIGEALRVKVVPLASMPPPWALPPLPPWPAAGEVPVAAVPADPPSASQSSTRRKPLSMTVPPLAAMPPPSRRRRRAVCRRRAATLATAAGPAVATHGYIELECEASQRRLGRAARGVDEQPSAGGAAAGAAGYAGCRRCRRCRRRRAQPSITVPGVEVKDVAVVVLAKMAPPKALPPSCRARPRLAAVGIATLEKVVAVQRQRTARGTVNAAARPPMATSPTREPLPEASLFRICTLPLSFSVPLLKMAPPSPDDTVPISLPNAT